MYAIILLVGRYLFVTTNFYFYEVFISYFYYLAIYFYFVYYSQWIDSYVGYIWLFFISNRQQACLPVIHLYNADAELTRIVTAKRALNIFKSVPPYGGASTDASFLSL